MQEHEINNNAQLVSITNLVGKLKRYIQEIPDEPNYEKLEVAFADDRNFKTQSFQNFSSEHSLDFENQLKSYLSSNKSLKVDLDHYDIKLSDLNKNIEDIKLQTEKFNEVKFHAEQQPLSLTTTLNLSNITSVSPNSLPILNSSTNSHFHQKLKALENEILLQESKTNKLKQQNIQLQVNNRELEKRLKQLQDTEKNQKIKLQELNSKTASTEPIRFSPQQKPYIDEFRDRLNREVAELKQQLDAVVVETQANIAAAQRNQSEAENRSRDLQRQVDLAEREATATSSQIKELETALVVATRVPPQSLLAQNQETINSLKQLVRQRENEFRKRSQDLAEARRANQTLKEQLRQQEPATAGHAIVRREPGGGRTTIERNIESVIVTNEGVTISRSPIDEVE